MENYVRARHTVSGKIAEVPLSIFNHDILGKYLEEVGEDDKPYVPELHTPRPADKRSNVRIVGSTNPDETPDKDEI